MWWLFEKIAKNGAVVLYAYSRGNRNLDGRIEINSETGAIEMITPSNGDAGNEYAEQKAVQKATLMAKKGFPQHMQIACG